MATTSVVPGGAIGVATSAPFTLQGNLVFDHGLPAVGVSARLYKIGFAGKDVQLGQVTSDAQGKYSFSYAPPSSPPNLQVRALDPAGKEITISANKFNAGPSETLDLVVPASVQPLAPEMAIASLESQCETILANDAEHPRCARGLGRLFVRMGDLARAPQCRVAGAELEGAAGRMAAPLHARHLDPQGARARASDEPRRRRFRRQEPLNPPPV